MKRSTKVVLTLLVPAMTAFGCGQSPTMVHPPGSHQTANDCDTPAKPGEPAKRQCHPAATQGSHYGSSHGSWFGGTHTQSAAPPTSHGATSSSRVTSVSTGGFGRIGSFFSGGS
jgi:hypothetical protein